MLKYEFILDKLSKFDSGKINHELYAIEIKI